MPETLRMNFVSAVTFLPQALLSACAAVLAIWIRLPWPAVVALGLLAVELTSVSRRKVVRRREWFILLGGTVVALGSLLFVRISTLDLNFSALGCLQATAFILASFQLPDLVAKKRLQ